MKRLVLIFTIALTGTVALNAQQIRYESSFENAIAMALHQHKPLSVLITFQPPGKGAYNNSGLNDPKVIHKFNESFINFKVDRSDTISKKIINKYRINRFPSFLFFDYKGGLLFSDIAFLSIPQMLLMTADKAIFDSRGKSMVDYDSLYHTGTESKSFLKDYILKREKAGIIDNADLIEKYVRYLNVTDLNNYAEVLFILQAGPYIDSIAFKMAHVFLNIKDSIFRNESAETRISINNAVVGNNLNKAIADKNQKRAFATADFAKKTYGNIMDGIRAGDKILLKYYWAVKDTDRYLRLANGYFENNYMNLSKDSIDKIESKNYERSSRTHRIVSAKDSIASILNNAAWNFYLIAGNQTKYLQRALNWSRFAIELYPRSAFYDTYAHILYKLKFYSEAEEMQKQAIETGKTEKADIKALQNEFKKMKERSL